MHIEGHARTWFTPKQKAELWERWKSGRWVADVVRAIEEREQCLRSWLSMQELHQRHAGELRRVVLRRPVELTVKNGHGDNSALFASPLKADQKQTLAACL
jgi:hypothetical protein